MKIFKSKDGVYILADADNKAGTVVIDNDMTRQEVIDACLDLIREHGKQKLLVDLLKNG